MGEPGTANVRAPLLNMRHRGPNMSPLGSSERGPPPPLTRMLLPLPTTSSYLCHSQPAPLTALCPRARLLTAAFASRRWGRWPRADVDLGPGLQYSRTPAAPRVGAETPRSVTPRTCDKGARLPQTLPKRGGVTGRPRCEQVGEP